MKKTLITLLGVVTVVVLGAQTAFAGTMPSAPVLLVPPATVSQESQQPVIAGVAPADTRVAIYINDVFNGYAEQVSEENGVQSFKYTPFLALAKGSVNAIGARAEDLDAGTRSMMSEYILVSIQGIAPQPIVVGTVVEELSTIERPWIVGLAGSGHEVDIYIDRVYVGTTVASEDVSGTGSFKFRPTTALTMGDHRIVAIATPDARVSKQSEPKFIVQLEGSHETIVAEESTDDAPVAEITETGPTEEAVEETVEVTAAEVEEVVEETSAGEAMEEVAEDQPEEVVEEATEESSEESDEMSEDDFEEGDDNEAVADTESDDEDSEESEGSEDEEETSTARTVIGWALLIIAALILVTSFRRRRTAQGAEVTPGPSTGESKNDDQLTLHAPKENKNIEVVKKDDSSSNESNDSN